MIVPVEDRLRLSEDVYRPVVGLYAKANPTLIIVILGCGHTLTDRVGNRWGIGDSVSCPTCRYGALSPTGGTT